MKTVLGFNYTPSLFKDVKSKVGVERAIFRLQQRFPEYIWNDSINDGKAYTYPMVKTVLDGVTMGGNKLNHQLDILNQKRALKNRLR